MIPKVIILTSNEPWGKVWYSKQHYANELANLGYKVYFINPPRSWKFQNLFHSFVFSRKILENLEVIDIQNRIPLVFFHKLSLRLNDWLNCRALLKFIGTQEVVFWHFDPFRFVFVYPFDVLRVYHVVDPYQHLVTDRILATYADIIIVVSPYYLTQYSTQKTLLIPHGISLDEVSLEENKLAKIRRSIGKGFVLFAGTINRDVDLELFRMLDDRGVRTIIIGPDVRKNGDFKKMLVKCDNLIYLGSQPAQKLKYYISLSSVCVVPYLENMEGNVHRTPLKIVNYLAQRKPIVTTINYELSQFEGSFIYTCHRERFVEKVVHLAKCSNTFGDKELDQYLKDMQYPVLIEKIFTRLRNDK